MNEQSAFKIESNDLAIHQIFKDFYTVPDFQREYVWERDHVDKLLQDVLDEFYDEDNQQINGPEYFLGSIVACRDPEGIFQLIDGQQRMTTIYLVLCAARDAMVDAGERPTRVLESQITDAYSDATTGDDIERHRLTLQYEDSGDVLEQLAKTNPNVDGILQTTESVRKILSAYRCIREFLLINFKNDSSAIKLFLLAFTRRIKLIRILTPTITNALKVFETINDRGVGLNAMDLLKNLLFMKTSQDEYPTLKDRWKRLIDILDQSGEKPLRFLRYYIMSHYDVDARRGIREDEIYDWFVDNSEYCGIDERPIEFAQTLIECADTYSNYLSAKDPQGNENRFLQNLSLLGGALRQQHILLLAGRHLSPDLFDQLCRSIENLFFCYIITREPTKTFERNFTRWANELRRCFDRIALDAFLEKYLVADLRGRTERFDFAFRELGQADIQQYRMRYILGKLTQYVEERAWGSSADHRLERYVDRSVHVEHIQAQTPTNEIRGAFDKPDEYDEYVGMLGNLTLLESTINSSVSNGSYAEKLPGYRQSQLLLTRSLAERPQVGTDTRLNRAAEDLIQFQSWDSRSIQRRQEMLSRLARKVWDMPASEHRQE